MAAPERVAPVEVTDAELVERLGRGDEEAFNRLYDRYFPRVYHFVNKRLRNRADTEETVQEVFTVVFSSIGTYRGEAPFAAWVLGVARRTIANRFKKKRHPTVPFEDSDGPEGVASLAAGVGREPSPLEHYEYRERIEHMESSARRHLSHEQWELFVLHHLLHRSIQEIARTFKKSEDSVKSTLYRARKLLFSR